MRPSPCGRGQPWLQSETWSRDVREGLEQMLDWQPEPGGPPLLAALDFDETCIFGDISETLLAILAEERSEALVDSYNEACRADMRRAYIDLVTTLVGGRTEREARDLALKALSIGGKRSRIGIREEMRELVWALQRHGWEIRVITASAEPLVQAVAERMGIHPNHVHGMRPPLQPDGRYGQGVLSPVPYREGKLEVLRLAAGRDPDFAAGDSRSDAALMAAAKRALLWDRGDIDLRSEASARGYWIAQGRRQDPTHTDGSDRCSE